MADSAPGYGRRPDEPQCYNCGLMGHWAVGCPEPTRKTPAGLEAWRNTSHSGAGPTDNRGGQKKQKGPIITRYAPPGSAPDYSNHSNAYTGWSQYAQAPPPPPPPAGHASRPPYHPQPPPPPQHQPPGHYTHYPPQSYQHPSGYYQSSGYPPPPPPAGSHDYGGRPPPPPPHDYRSHGGRQQPPVPPPPYPPSYHSYPPEPPPGVPHIPPLPPPPPSARSHGTPSRPPPTNRGPPGLTPSSHSPPIPRAGHGFAQKTHPPPNSSNRRTSSGQSAPRPSIAMAAADMIAHGLPPKPPPSKMDQGDMRRDHQNKKGQNKQQGNRGNHRAQESQGSRRQQKKKNRKNRQREKTQSQAQTPRQESVPTDRQGSLSRSESLLETKDNDRPVADTDNGTEAGDDSVVDKGLDPDEKAQAVAIPEVGLEKTGEEEAVDRWEEEAIFSETEVTHPPDEVGKPLPSIYTEDILLPRKWDAKCLESEFFDADSVEDFSKPIHESQYWDFLQYDPAFTHNGALPSGKHLSVILKEMREYRNAAEKRLADEQRLLEQDRANPPQQPIEDEPPLQERSSKRKRSAEPVPEGKSDHQSKAAETVDILPQPSPNRNRPGFSPRPDNAQYESPLRRASPPLGRERRRTPDRSRARDGRDSHDQRRSRSPGRRRPSPDFHRSRTPDRRRRSPDFRRHRSPDHRRRYSERRSPSPARRRHSRSRSRHSSLSPPVSRASSLDSLERELLGLSESDKTGQQAEESERAHSETERATKPKRRRAQVDSAYSRRW